jgi:hypothetical protein
LITVAVEEGKSAAEDYAKNEIAKMMKGIFR